MDAGMLRAFRFVPVIALLGGAAALLRPPGELPLALRGLKKILGQKSDEVPKVSTWKKFAAFLCVLLALVLALV